MAPLMPPPNVVRLDEGKGAWVCLPESFQHHGKPLALLVSARDGQLTVVVDRLTSDAVHPAEMEVGVTLFAGDPAERLDAARFDPDYRG
jgi:hypothetical protein